MLKACKWTALNIDYTSDTTIDYSAFIKLSMQHTNIYVNN